MPDPDIAAVDRCLETPSGSTNSRWCSCHTWTPTTWAAWPGRSTDARSEPWPRGPCPRPTTACPPSTPCSGGQRPTASCWCGGQEGSGRRRPGVLAPQPERATAAAEPNDLSLVVRATVRVRWPDRRSRGRGRGPAADERWICGPTLKVPHHGSADTDPGFLTATGARAALVSVGADNTYGHPARSVLETLTGAGMRVQPAPDQGDVAVVGSAEDWGGRPWWSSVRATSGTTPPQSDRRPIRARFSWAASGPPWHHSGVSAAASVPPLSRSCGW